LTQLHTHDDSGRADGDEAAGARDAGGLVADALSGCDVAPCDAAGTVEPVGDGVVDCDATATDTAADRDVLLVGDEDAVVPDEPLDVGVIDTVGVMDGERDTDAVSDVVAVTDTVFDADGGAGVGVGDAVGGGASPITRRYMSKRRSELDAAFWCRSHATTLSPRTSF
jgi:hypothetical protein